MIFHGRSYPRSRGPIALVPALLALSAPPATARAAYAFDSSEAAFDANYANTPISLTGRVVDWSGQPIAGVSVTVIAFGDGSSNAGKSDLTDGSGQFSITGLKRRSALLRVTLGGWYTEIVPVDLQRPLGETTTSAGDVVVTEKQDGRARLVFVGDTMLGRRFTDADEDGLEGEAGDLIRPGSRSADAKKIVAYVRDAISAADYAVANLECAVTADPDTPHPYKAYTFYSHPDTLDGLVHAGFDAVSLGNNHIFDYMGPGVFDTLSALTGLPDPGLEFAGAEMNETDAAMTTIHIEPGGVPLALQGFSTKRSDGSTQTKYLLVARDPDKPGALEATNGNLSDFLEGEVGDRLAIPMIHGGVEYSSYPSNEMRGMFVDLIEQGAGLVVAHHTHTAQGIGLVDPGDGPRFALLSLGNFLFDQNRFETWQSMIAVADVDLLPGGAFEVARLQLIPLHVEWYVPKLLAGAWMTRADRNFAHLSTTLPRTPSGSGTPDGLTGAVVFPVGHRAVAFASSSQYQTTTQSQGLSLSVKSGATDVVEFVPSVPADMLAKVQSSATAQLEYGRDILLFGDFEDLDVDGDFHEKSMWNVSESKYLQNSAVRSGIGAAVLLRKSSNSGSIELYNERVIPVRRGGKLTLVGWVRGENAGTFRLKTTTYESDGDSISTVERYARSGGTYGWTRFAVSLTLPSNAVDLKVRLQQSPPNTGEGRVYIDDLAVVEWDPPAGDAKAGADVPAPNNYGFVRFTGISGGVAALGVTLTHRIYSLP